MELLSSRLALSNALSGAAADAFSTVALCPLDAIKLHMQADSKLTLREVLQHTFGDHPLEPYKGIAPKVIQSVQQKFQYFYVYALLKELHKRRTGAAPSVALDLLFGYLAALQGLASTLPLEVTNTRIITTKRKRGERKPGFRETFLDQLRTEGPYSFYRTLSASAILCINPAISFSVFEVIKARVLQRRNAVTDVLTTFEAFVIGVVSKAIATILTFPFIRAKVMMSVWKKRQEQHLASEEPNVVREQPGMLATIEGIVQVEGWRGLYVGLEPQLVKAVTNAALMLVVKEKIYGIVKAVVMGAGPAHLEK